MFVSADDSEGRPATAVAHVTIREYWPLETFERPEFYYGDPLPDVAFVQLNVRGVPTLPLALEPWTVRVGTRIATAGFPLGEDPLTCFGVRCHARLRVLHNDDYGTPCVYYLPPDVLPRPFLIASRVAGEYAPLESVLMEIKFAGRR